VEEDGGKDKREMYLLVTITGRSPQNAAHGFAALPPLKHRTTYEYAGHGGSKPCMAATHGNPINKSHGLLGQFFVCALGGGEILSSLTSIYLVRPHV
jgi:hypothetical protein